MDGSLRRRTCGGCWPGWSGGGVGRGRCGATTAASSSGRRWPSGWAGGGIERMAVAPASPWQNGYVESFHGKLWDEFLDRSVFADVAAQAAWYRREYNTVRPHSGLGYQTPQAFAATCSTAGGEHTG